MTDVGSIDWVSGAMQFIVFLFSTTVHEAAHALPAAVLTKPARLG